MDQDPSSSANAASAPEWKPLTAKQRRVLGTLMEKSKTTPDAYPMTFAGLTTGCNQKSNRTPITNYTPEQVEAVVDELRTLGAVAIVQGSGRVTKVRHYAYNWLGLDKIEAAVMTELLLRGEQTFGELRTRASRMEPIQDLDELKGIVDRLIQRNLMVELSPQGRGQIVSHNLYPEWELEAVFKSVAAGVSGVSLSGSTAEDSIDPEISGATHRSQIGQTQKASASSQEYESRINDLEDKIAVLSQRLEKLEQVFEKELGNNG